MMILDDIIVHRLDKESNGIGTSFLRRNLLPVQQQETDFITNVKQIYYNKSNPNYGVFNSDIVGFPYQMLLDNYLNGTVTFIQFSINAMQQLVNIINTSPPATGGYIVFAHYRLQSEEFVMIVMLNNKKQYNINDDLNISEIFTLDIDKLDVANSVNITRWRNLEETYLSFARGRKDISNYFKSFIGCTNQTSARQSSQNLKRALLDYIENLELDNAGKEDLRNRVFNYCIDKIKRKEDIPLSHLSSMIDEENPNLFQEFAAGEEYRVDHHVKGHKSTLKSLKFYVYRSKKLTIEFDSSLIADNTITYNEQSNELTIRNVPELLRTQFVQGNDENVD